VATAALLDVVVGITGVRLTSGGWGESCAGDWRCCGVAGGDRKQAKARESRPCDAVTIPRPVRAVTLPFI
jgi:hypothetical protein